MAATFEFTTTLPISPSRQRLYTAQVVDNLYTYMKMQEEDCRSRGKEYLERAMEDVNSNLEAGIYDDENGNPNIETAKKALSSSWEYTEYESANEKANAYGRAAKLILEKL